MGMQSLFNRSCYLGDQDMFYHVKEHCMTKPDLIFRLEHGFEPRSIDKASLWSLPGAPTTKRCLENQQRHVWHVGSINSNPSSEVISEVTTY
ncbi:zinc finger protein 39-like isoform X2 [Nannospalax galili]|uniref:zinc finger protein 39-like isoform X2 n=1 Tax=Nannospalax galili TaxID=1026970 RepID=UPI00111BE719|nr:zinc finger protein 39-like isoform X2 [Nannospalax galili]